MRVNSCFTLIYGAKKPIEEEITGYSNYSCIKLIKRTTNTTKNTNYNWWMWKFTAVDLSCLLYQEEAQKRSPKAVLRIDI
jgi:hypothetical protein